MERPPVRDIAAAVLQRGDGRLLLLKRSPTHRTNPAKWCFVTGYVNPGEDPRAAAIREVHEELGLAATPSRAGSVVTVEEVWATLHVHPFLFHIPDFDVTLDWEHVDYVWIVPVDIYQYECVKQLDDDLRALGLLE